MNEKQQTGLFRRQAMEKVSSPEHLSDYLRVTNPGVWVVLAAVILLLAGLLVWASVGTLETTAEAGIVVEDHTARVWLIDDIDVEVGMPLRVAGQEAPIASVETDSLGRSVGCCELPLPDGTYEGVVVIERTRPISFLLESR